MVKNIRIKALILFIAIILAGNLFTFCGAQEKLTYDSKGKRNPFISLVTSDGRLLKLDNEEKTKQLGLEGIIYDTHGISYAILNGTVVRIGDFIDGYQVLKIEPNKVIVIKDSVTSEIELKKEE
jgi:hypothetical protein